MAKKKQKTEIFAVKYANGAVVAETDYEFQTIVIINITKNFLLFLMLVLSIGSLNSVYSRKRKNGSHKR